MTKERILEGIILASATAVSLVISDKFARLVLKRTKGKAAEDAISDAIDEYLRKTKEKEEAESKEDQE